MITPIAKLAAGPRGKWVVLGGWLALVAVLGTLGMKLPGGATDDTAAALPSDTQSGEGSRLLKERFPGGETQPALMVSRRQSGLSAPDRAAIAAAAARAGRVPLAEAALVPFGPRATPGLASRDGRVAVVIVPLGAGNAKAQMDA